MQIDVYINTTAQGPAWQEAEGYFVIKLCGWSGTMRHESARLFRTRTTARILSCELLVNAFYILNKYANDWRISDEDTVHIHADSNIIHLFSQKQFNKWCQSGWKDSKGRDLPSQYRRLYEVITESNRSFDFSVKGEEEDV